MKTEMKTTFLLLFFLVAHAYSRDQRFKLKCPEETVKAQVGHNVTLNCTSEPQQDLTNKEISWESNSIVLLHFKDRKMSRHQPEQFRGRVHTINSWDVSKGKLSVEISSVNESDAGNYTCFVVGVSDCTVTLTVDIKPPNGNPTENPDAGVGDTPLPSGAIIGIVVGVVLSVVAVALVAGLIYRNNRTRGREQAPNQDDREVDGL